MEKPFSLSRYLSTYPKRYKNVMSGIEALGYDRVEELIANAQQQGKFVYFHSDGSVEICEKASRRFR